MKKVKTLKTNDCKISKLIFDIHSNKILTKSIKELIVTNDSVLQSEYIG
jgi:hypothetical protein